MPADSEALDPDLVREVAHMLNEWIGTDELPTEFAERLLRFVRDRASK